MSINRRSFLKNSVTTAAGMGMVPSVAGSLLAYPAGTKANDKIVLALIGARNMGWGDLMDLLKQPNVECKTLCDVDDAVLIKRQQNWWHEGHRKPTPGKRLPQGTGGQRH